MGTPERSRPHPGPEEGVRHGRLSARPVAVARTASPLEPGVHRLDGRALFAVPPTPAAGPSPLAVVLHGAGGTAEEALEWLLPHASELGVLLLAPQAVSATWDVIVGGYGADVSRIDAALEEAFARAPVAVGAVAVAGFSDGASYALSLGLANGDLFRDVLAFSPGFMVPMIRHGRPRIFVSHGVSDRVLPIDECSRRLVPELRESGYEVTYEEFRGGHQVPPEIAAAAVRWWISPRPGHGTGDVSPA
ncbi:alpha/beta hydrolase [Microbispora hainanensis]|uniref:Phospholipase n=1 Tax=Microbispora hainanensis TaxID=568844 RepID=A0A544Z057_9ACTN|nr:phospholipase [Microbispora hainanensis]TQS22426.1 phospholipase [Microbispora hainanensis]